MKYLALAISLLLSNAAFAADYVIDTKGQHAYVIFKASHLGYSYIVGHFEDFEGSFTHDAKNPEASKAQITIKTASLDTDHAERDKHLKGSEYFDAGKYPEIVFTSTGYEGTATEGNLRGTLQLHGVEKEVSLAIKQVGEGKDPWGGYRSGFEGSVTLAAGDWGLQKWIGDVEVSLIVEGVLKK